MVIGKGIKPNGVKGLKSMTIPMFSAKGLGFRRANNELIVPYYFAYEDLLEDWKKLEQTKLTEPQVVVKDFTEVMCLSSGLVSSTGEGKDNRGANKKNAGIVPPRREIGLFPLCILS